MNRSAGIFLVIILFFGFACDILYDCENERRIHFEVGFYQIKEGVVRDSIVDSLNVYGLGREDSLIIEGRLNVQTMVLPLDPSKDSSVFVLILDETQTEFSVFYERIPVFISDECGLAIKYKLLGAGFNNSVSDSIEITEEEVNEIETEHIRIYL